MKLLRCLCLLSILASAYPALAIPIVDTVVVGSQEWAQVDLFTNVSWNDLNAQCPGGVCALSSEINGYDLAGWTWASIDTVQLLFNSFTGEATPAPGTYFEQNSAWAPSFLSLFNPTVSDSTADRSIGWTANQFSANFAYYAFIEDSAEPFFDTARTEAVEFKGQPFDSVGAWLVRDATPAPAPATLVLFGLGLVSLCATRRKRGAKL